MSPSTSASLPPAKYARPSLIDVAVRQVNFVDPDGRSKVFDFTDIHAAPVLLDDLVRAFASGVAPGGRWQSVATAEAAAGTAKHLARYLKGIPHSREHRLELLGVTDTGARFPHKVTLHNGCMSYVPGSNLGALLPHRSFGDDPRVHAIECPGEHFDQALAQPQPVAAGTCILHAGRTLHSALPNRSDGGRLAYVLAFRGPLLPRREPQPNDELAEEEAVLELYKSALGMA